MLRLFCKHLANDLLCLGNFSPNQNVIFHLLETHLSFHNFLMLRPFVCVLKHCATCNQSYFETIRTAHLLHPFLKFIILSYVHIDALFHTFNRAVFLTFFSAIFGYIGYRCSLSCHRFNPFSKRFSRQRKTLSRRKSRSHLFHFHCRQMVANGYFIGKLPILFSQRMAFFKPFTLIR